MGLLWWRKKKDDKPSSRKKALRELRGAQRDIRRAEGGLSRNSRDGGWSSGGDTGGY
ncbi:hypothetical protein [Amycolatopsis acididurans]|uniref:hypothetical protein n=1 Tax=Amycolatopsis acididurans TaxID=2724524 RepID=UPI001FE49E04|nr:hypothetical protein [Amycolatopsis acididurans]